ncbi:SDR family NAD(P)-dependent oxidoreductase [Natronococcus wangiae]|uniref:SDR family NAD(P)-dependent oxidoreductase n=1 Tax=Natronococcus wangiae TaxID=3068275 RepID=UPI00273E790F|nr:SDR family oxidoreductase [Natronococcus sp. AD5]
MILVIIYKTVFDSELYFIETEFPETAVCYFRFDLSFIACGTVSSCMNHSENVVIVTGAGSGMGRAVSRRFGTHGAAVACVDLDHDAATTTAAEIRDESSDAIAIEADVSDATDVETMIDRTVEAFGRLDVLHNNAGIPQEGTPVEDVTEATWDRILDVNLKSAFLGAKYAVPHLRESEGVILNTASTAAIRPRTGLSAYVASKGGMVALTKQLAYELAPTIRVNAICPVATDTPMLDEFAGDELSVESMAATIPMGRLATPRDVAEAAVFLASDDAAMITGTALEVDGGRDI